MVYIKWFSLLLAISSMVLAMVFFNESHPRTIKKGAASIIHEIHDLKLSQNNELFWYRLNADYAREEPIYLGGLQSNIFSYMSIKNIAFQTSIKSFGYIKIIADTGMIDLPLKHLQLHDPVIISSNLGLSGHAYHVDINLQTGIITLKKAAWAFQQTKNYRIEENWEMKSF